MKCATLLLAIHLTVATLHAVAAPVGTSFTYQGELRQSGTPSNGAFDFEFALYNVSSSGIAIASNTHADAVVIQGLFNVELDFTEVPFAAAQEYYIEVRVRDGTSVGGYQQLLPRQKVTPAPYALNARSVQEGGVNQNSIAANAVGNAQLQANSVGSSQIGNLAVTGAKLADASITVSKLAFTPGDVTSVAAGNGLSGDGTSGDLELAVDTNTVQARITGSCDIGEYFRGIEADGTVMCASVLSFLGIKITTTVEDLTGTVGRYSDIAIGSDGFAIISYFDQGAAALKVAKCSNAACSGATITAVDDPAGALNSAGEYASIAIGSDGLPVISYLQSFMGPGTLKVAKCSNVDCSGIATITTVDDPVNGVGAYTSIAIGSDTRPVISYWDNSAGSLKVAKCSNADCTGVATITTVDDPANSVGEHTAIAVGNDGLPVISYYDSSAGALKTAKCGTAECSGASTITTIDDPPGQVGQFTSIAIGNDALPVISYFDTSGALYVAKCSNTNCSGSTALTRVDIAAGAITGRYTSIALGADGLPVISYEQAFGTSSLKVAKCANAACSGLATTLTIADDSPHSVGQYSALAIGSDGLPVISYFDSTAGSLKVLKCGTRSCQ